MASWRDVKKLEDGASVEAATFNVPITQLADRTDYLLNLLKGLRGEGKFTSVRIDVKLSKTNTPIEGDIVCVDPDTKEYVKAVASMDLYDAYTASETAYAVGILVSKSDYDGVVCLYGLVDLSDGLDVDSMVESGKFVNGQYYLSSVAPGKITRFPTGPRILVGFFSRNQLVNGTQAGDFALINPQHMDIEAHSHRTYVLKPRPSGEVVVDASTEFNVEDTVRIVGYATDLEYESGVKINGMPRLCISGEWSTWNDAEYEVQLTAYDGTSEPASWNDCWFKWTAKSGDSGSGAVQIRHFGDAVPIGSYGMEVYLEADDGMDLDRPVAYQGSLDVRYRTWKVNRDRARGWTQASEIQRDDFGSGWAVIEGSPKKEYDEITMSVPKKVFVLSPTEQPADHDVVTVDGVEYTFIEDSSNDVELGENEILIDGSPYETYRKLCDFVEVSAYDDELEMIVIGAKSVSGVDFVEFTNDDDIVLANGVGSVYVVVSDSDGKSVVQSTENEKLYPFIRIAGTYSSVKLTDGMSLYVAPSSGTSVNVSVGDSVSFEIGNGQSDAKFRYNISFDNDLDKHFPPVPARSGSVMLNGVELESREHFGPKAIVAIGDDSIYWLDNTSGRSPWPISYSNVNSEVTTDDEFRLLFHFVSEFHSETGPVTSLRPASGSPITVKRCGTDDDATVGDLELDVNLLLSTAAIGVSGHNVVKASRGNKLLLGPVVEKIVAGPGISVTQRSSSPAGQGIVTISADSGAYYGDFETIALENAKLESIGMFPYIRMLRWAQYGNNIPSGFVAKFHIPATANDAVYKVRFYATVFGEESVEGADAKPYAGITMDYNILPDYNSVSGSTIETASFNLKSDLIKPNNPIVLDIPFGTADDDNMYSYNSYDPVLIHNDVTLDTVPGKSELVLDHAIPDSSECSAYVKSHTIATTVFGVRPGYTIAMRFSRSAPSSGSFYEAPIGLINLRWAIVEDASAKQVQQDLIQNIVDSTVMKMRKAAASIDTAAMVNSDAVVDVVTKVVKSIVQ